MQHLEWLLNLQTPSSKNQAPVHNKPLESPRLTALKTLPPTEALDLLQADDWLQDLIDFSGVLPGGAADTSSSMDMPPPPAPTALTLTKESSMDENLDEEIIQQCIKSLNTAIRRCPTPAQQAEMQKVARLLALKPSQIAQLEPRERKKVLTIRKSSIQKMQLANDIRKTKAADLEAEQMEKALDGLTGRSPSLRPRGASVDGKAALDGKGRMPPASHFPPSKVQKSGNGSSPDI